MNDDTPNPLGNGQKATLYMETLRARMDPAQYESLAHRLRKAFHLLAQGRDGTITSDDDLVFTPEMNREFTVVLNILLTGKMDQQIVEVDGNNGESGFVLMDPEDANNPAKVQEVRDFMIQWRTDRERMDAELDGIARASSMHTDTATPTDKESAAASSTSVGDALHQLCQNRCPGRATWARAATRGPGRWTSSGDHKRRYQRYIKRET
ncbi:hypothetical protein AB0L83_34700 [Streptomyces sp. NPDC052071]|uniref:hypothetical protein n=1 Tax=Streptomyces sp. NPDC052071 TaxID=3156666 RepID=UPI0034265E7E